MSANDSQVGGDHYKTEGKPEHWDLVVMYGWDYFQGQITKYVMRWRAKNKDPHKGIVDLEKARHFLDKYIEVEKARLEEFTPRSDVRAILLREEGMHADWTVEGFYGDNTQLYQCRTCRRTLRQAVAPHHPCDHPLI